MKHFLSKETEEKYNILGIPYKKNYIFEGLPGTGKTSLVRALATKYNMSIAILDFDSEMDDKRLRHSIQRLPKKTVLLLEDIDCLFCSRTRKDNDASQVTFSGILNALDGVVQNDDTIVIMTTNHITKLDEALKRRVDYFVKFDNANKEQIKQMYEQFFPNYKHKFNEFYKKISTTNITTNVLQKFFTKYLFKDITEHTEDLETFIHVENMEKSIYT